MDLTGRKFGRLTVLFRDEKSKPKRIYWRCRCECGTEKAVLGGHLTMGRIVSCGCRMRETAVTHGLSKTRTHRIWNSMLNRCGHYGAPRKHYGERGIRVCERWVLFENFLADMGECPEGLSIDRINNDGDYEPANCRWATRAEQAMNRSNHRYLTHEGRTLTLVEWSKETGLAASAISRRIDRGWDVSRALTTVSQRFYGSGTPPAG